MTLVKNGAEAIDTLSNVRGFFDLVISDIEMPEMAWFELVRRIRYGVVPRYKDIPILMLTGHSTEGNVQKGKFHKIQGFTSSRRARKFSSVKSPGRCGSIPPLARNFVLVGVDPRQALLDEVRRVVDDLFLTAR